MARGLENGRKAAIALYDRLRADSRFATVFPPELDIVIWAPRAKKSGGMSIRSKEIFEAAAKQNLHLAVAAFPKTMLEKTWDIEWDSEHIACLRSCLMKSDHVDWIEQIWRILDDVAGGR